MLADTWISDTLIGELNYRDMGLGRVEPGDFTGLMLLLKDKKIYDKQAIEMLRINLDHRMKGEPIEKWDDLIEKHGFKKISPAVNVDAQSGGEFNLDVTDPVTRAIAEVLTEHPAAVEDFRKGKKGAFNFLIGQLMKKTRGCADPGELNRLLTEELEKKEV
jgi:aspartyl-tRNA(Asn)/glutamyl-tRNA(Gln) amidotransferase subunit B